MTFVFTQAHGSVIQGSLFAVNDIYVALDKSQLVPSSFKVITHCARLANVALISYERIRHNVGYKAGVRSPQAINSAVKCTTF